MFRKLCQHRINKPIFCALFSLFFAISAAGKFNAVVFIYYAHLVIKPKKNNAKSSTEYDDADTRHVSLSSGSTTS